MVRMPRKPGSDSALSARLLDWYDRHRRTLPWRAEPGETADPYRVWLSEIMLQQTKVAAVKSYFEAFTTRWPTVQDLAAADLADVLTEWAGLGYYARARNLHKCARAVAARGGVFPDTEEELLELPGVGPYTAAAIAAIAFGRRASPLDGNIERVLARMFAVDEPLPGAKARLREIAAQITPPLRAGDYAQAAMDLGATICTPRKPACALCPWMEMCAGRRLGIAEELPRRAAKAERPTRRGIIFWAEDGTGRVLIRRRPEKGLLGGMMEFPSTAWGDGCPELSVAVKEAPVRAEWRPLPGQVRHTFTHFHLELDVVVARAKPSQNIAGEWCAIDRLGEQALPSLMRKVVRHALKHIAS
jgi:A/G-specific adenine glycosylase